jgi:hypothetical protein
MNQRVPATPAVDLDPILMAVLANRLNAIVREMTNTLLKTARSAVLAVVRDFSCSIVTGDNRLLCAAEGAPVHIFGSSLQTAAMCELHPDLAPGDAFLHNDPYLGNTHPADHMYMVPVFVDGQHLFTACAKAHQADCGNAIPSTYYANARDIYEEGALIFPCVRVQRDYAHVDDIIRMCRRRIRVPEQWYGDYLASIGSARVVTAPTPCAASSRPGSRIPRDARWKPYAGCRPGAGPAPRSTTRCRRCCPRACRSGSTSRSTPRPAGSKWISPTTPTTWPSA